MVTEDKISNRTLMRYRLGTVLVWVGVLTWAPFIMLRVAGEKPSLFLFLPFHLLGVIAGSRLRALARKEMGALAPKRNFFHLTGHGLIYIGILVWAPFFYQKFVTQQAVEVVNYLPYHLTGVLGGIMVLGLGYLIKRSNRQPPGR